MNLKKIGKLFTSKFVGTGPLSYKKRIYGAAVSQRLRNTTLSHEPTIPSSPTSVNKEVFQNKLTFTTISAVVTFCSLLAHNRSFRFVAVCMNEQC